MSRGTKRGRYEGGYGAFIGDGDRGARHPVLASTQAALVFPLIKPARVVGAA